MSLVAINSAMSLTTWSRLHLNVFTICRKWSSVQNNKIFAGKKHEPGGLFYEQKFLSIRRQIPNNKYIHHEDTRWGITSWLTDWPEAILNRILSYWRSFSEDYVIDRPTDSFCSTASSSDSASTAAITAGWWLFANLQLLTYNIRCTESTDRIYKPASASAAAAGDKV